MMLRMMLVGLVASLGLELPSDSDVASWTRSGQAWASARLADLAEIRSEAGCVLAGRGEPDPALEAAGPAAVEVVAPATDDVTFEAVSAQVANEFAADLAAVTPASPAAEQVAQAEAEAPMLAAPTVEAAPVAVVACESDEVPSDEAEVAMLAEANPTRAERINSAVKMTYQAVHAWASALGATDEGDAAR